MNIFGAIGKKSIKAIGGMTKAEIEAAAEAERAAAQASWDRVAGMEPAREKTGLRYSPAIGPELAGKQYAKDTAKFPGMAGFDPYEPRAIFDAQSASGLPVEIIRNPTRDDLLRMTAPSRDPNSASFRGSMSDALARYMTDDKGNRYAFSASDLVHQEAADALRGHGVPLKSYGGEGMAQDDNGVVRRFGDELTPSGVMSAKDLFRWRYGIPAGIGAATGAAVLGSPQDADAMPDAYALKEALTLTLGAGVAGGVYANAPTRSDELNDLISPAFNKLAGGDYLGAGFALGQGVPEYLERRQGDPQAAAADAFELWDPTGLASIPLQWWDQNKYNEDVVRRPDFSSDGGGPEVARYKKRAIFAKGRK